MQGHFGEVKKLVETGEKSDSYAKHFATQFPTTIPTPDDQRNGITCSIIWQGNPISVVKTFATKKCALCAKERTAIMKQHKLNPQLLINSNNKSTVPADTTPSSICMESRPPPALMSQSMTKKSIQHKLPQISIGAIFA